jgi:hypothetical protein
MALFPLALFANAAKNLLPKRLLIKAETERRRVPVYRSTRAQSVCAVGPNGRLEQLAEQRLPPLQPLAPAPEAPQPVVHQPFGPCSW